MLCLEKRTIHLVLLLPLLLRLQLLRLQLLRLLRLRVLQRELIPLPLELLELFSGTLFCSAALLVVELPELLLRIGLHHLELGLRYHWTPLHHRV